MRISGVLSHPIVKPNLALNFRGEKGSLVLQYPDDRFDKSVDLDDNTKTFDKDVEISKCYSNIINKLDLVSPKDVENIANVISKKLDNKSQLTGFMMFLIYLHSLLTIRVLSP